MKLKFIVLAVILVVGFGFSNAFALSIDKTSGNNSDGSAKFVDPDDHVLDNFQGGQAGNTGVSFGPIPSQGEPDAFQHAVENRQQ